MPEGDLSDLSPEAMHRLIFGSPEKEIFTLPGYRIQRELGRGGCGAVYLATPKSGGDPVAVKLMLSRAKADTRAIEHFKREMLHRNRAKISDVGLAKNFQKAVLSGMSMTGQYAGIPADQLTDLTDESNQLVAVLTTIVKRSRESNS